MPENRRLDPDEVLALAAEALANGDSLASIGLKLQAHEMTIAANAAEQEHHDD